MYSVGSKIVQEHVQTRTCPTGPGASCPCRSQLYFLLFVFLCFSCSVASIDNKELRIFTYIYMYMCV